MKLEEWRFPGWHWKIQILAKLKLEDELSFLYTCFMFSFYFHYLYIVSWGVRSHSIPKTHTQNQVHETLCSPLRALAWVPFGLKGCRLSGEALRNKGTAVKMLAAPQAESMVCLLLSLRMEQQHGWDLGALRQSYGMGKYVVLSQISPFFQWGYLTPLKYVRSFRSKCSEWYADMWP